MNFAGLSTVGAAALAGLPCACSLLAAAAAPPRACASPEPLRINLRATAHLNLSERGEPLPTVVRVYQLKGTGKISVASLSEC